MENLVLGKNDKVNAVKQAAKISHVVTATSHNVVTASHAQKPTNTHEEEKLP